MSSGVVKKVFNVILEENTPAFKPITFFKNVPNGFFKKHLGKGKNEYIILLEKIRTLLTNCPDLTTKQKIDFCCIERYFMKKYLKKIIVKII